MSRTSALVIIRICNTVSKTRPQFSSSGLWESRQPPHERTLDTSFLSLIRVAFQHSSSLTWRVLNLIEGQILETTLGGDDGLAIYRSVGWNTIHGTFHDACRELGKSMRQRNHRFRVAGN